MLGFSGCLDRYHIFWDPCRPIGLENIHTGTYSTCVFVACELTDGTVYTGVWGTSKMCLGLYAGLECLIIQTYTFVVLHNKWRHWRGVVY